MTFSIYYNYIPRRVASWLADCFNRDPLGNKRDYDADFFYQPLLAKAQSLVLGRGSELVACCLVDCHKTVLYPSHFIVHEAYRRQGLGSLMLDKLKERGKVLKLECWKENVEAQKFYEKNGFTLMYSTDSSVYMEFRDIVE